MLTMFRKYCKEITLGGLAGATIGAAAGAAGARIGLNRVCDRTGDEGCNQLNDQYGESAAEMGASVGAAIGFGIGAIMCPTYKALVNWWYQGRAPERPAPVQLQEVEVEPNQERRLPQRL